MSRLAEFEKLKTHPFYGNDFKKLTKGQIEECYKFIADREGLDRDAYAIDANRWVLTQPIHKNMTRMADLLTAVNVAQYEK